MDVVKIGLLGLGTVGTGVFKIITSMPDWEIKLGAKLEIKKVLVKDIDKKRNVTIDRHLLTTDYEEILNDDEIKIVIEVVGGIEPSKKFIIEALKRGKNIVTANKDLLADFGQDIFATAEKHNCDVRYEASVAGGIPIIAALKSSLIGNNIQKIMGIINGTTNFIFTKMEDEGYSYEKALSEAQRLGFAEINPNSDVEGLDAARKTAILSTIAFHSQVLFKDVYAEGITKVSDADFKYAKEMGYTIKLLGIIREDEGKIEARVHPTFISKKHPLASIKNENNAIFVTGDNIGETMFYGKGAGELPTASSVVGDVTAIAQNISNSCVVKRLSTCYYDKPIKPMDEIENRFYVRLIVEDHPGVLANIASVFSGESVSISELIQKKLQEELAELVVITDIVKEKSLRLSLEKIKSLECTKEISSVIRVEK